MARELSQGDCVSRLAEAPCAQPAISIELTSRRLELLARIACASTIDYRQPQPFALDSVKSVGPTIVPIPREIKKAALRAARLARQAA